MLDKYERFASSTVTPSEEAFAIVPNDTETLPVVPKFLYVGGAGDVVLRSMNSEVDVIFKNVPAGAHLFVRASHVRATGTTASAIVACA
ncbi:MAG: hypothetical protein QNI87_12675 [Erythrobacter sp.]|uniref:spike base protein, RCAP_Rcc01079 family n=1 Tax=Erythrobacter sp. TaxID=1042 RepID=UPI0026136B1D|nr:hypothetical protein [Erythrobacter sp.]MDJ0979373.1 hypothetical protein [Erythrobacter sp.]